MVLNDVLMSFGVLVQAVYGQKITHMVIGTTGLKNQTYYRKQ